jgi:hypothetical protein
MTDHAPALDAVVPHLEEIRRYDYGTGRAARFPLAVEDLVRLKEAVWLTPDDEQVLRDAVGILVDRVDDLLPG